jgi:hypothetical protein
VAALVTALVLLAVAAPIVALFRAQDIRIGETLRQISILRAEAAATPGLQAQSRKLRQQISASPGALQASSAALAQSQLQQALEGIATGNGASVRSTQMLPSEQSDGFETVAIQDDLTVPMNKLRDLIYAIETRTPYLFLDNVQIAGSQPWQPMAPVQDLVLNVRWTVHAYRRSTP